MVSTRSTVLLLTFLSLLAVPLQAAAQKVSVGSYEVESGETFTVSIIASNISNIAGIEVSLTYDPSIVNVQGYQLNEILADCFNFDNVNNSKGFAKIMVVCTDGISAQSLNVVNFTLKAVGEPGDETELKISANFSDTSFKLVVPETVNGYVKILGQESGNSATTTRTTTQSASSGSGSHSGSGSGSATQTTQTTQSAETTSESTESSGTGAVETPVETPESVTEESKSQSVEITTTYPPTTTEKTGIEKSEPTPGENRETEQGSFKIPGFEALLALFAIYLVWGLRR